MSLPLIELVIDETVETDGIEAISLSTYTRNRRKLCSIV